MNIVVVLRLMPALGDQLEFDAEGTDIDREGVGTTINEFDDHALEEAVLIKEATGATVTAIALQAEGIQQVLRVAFARGADRVVVVEAGERTPYDARAAALALSDAIRTLGPDLVLTGVQTPYDIFGQTAPYLAHALEWPNVNVVSSVQVVDGRLQVVQEHAGGRATVIAVRLPAVIGIQSASAPPRYVSVSRLRQAMTAGDAERIDVTGVGPTNGPKIVSFGRPEKRRSAMMLAGSPEETATQLATILRERGVLSG